MARLGGSGFWKAVAVAVVAGIILAALGYLAASARHVLAIAAAIGAAIVHPIPVPAVLLALLAAGTSAAILLVARRKRRRNPLLSVDEEKVVRLLAALSMRRLTALQVAGACNLTSLQAADVLYTLVARRFVARNPAPLTGEAVYHLAPIGRHYAVQKRYDREPLQPTGGTGNSA